MIIVKIIGGLGNQMFQYAYAKSLQQSGYEVKIDTSFFDSYQLHGGYQLDRYKTDLPLATREDVALYINNNVFFKIMKKIFKINEKNIRIEKSLLYDPELLSPDNNCYIDGYFQSEHYFLNIRAALLTDFSLRDQLSSRTKEIEKKIKNASSCSVSLHVRRGDYVNNQKFNAIHGTCNFDYYEQALDYLKYKFKKIQIFVFSDDIDWVKINLAINNPFYVISNADDIPHEDLYLMSLCDHHIIANSSFSWWGAWLQDNRDQVVIAPKKWFADEMMLKQSRDIVPEHWVRL